MYVLHIYAYIFEGILLVRRCLILCLFVILYANCGFVQSDTYPLPPLYIDVVGEIHRSQIQSGETLLDVARFNNLGHNEIVLANPAVDRWLPDVGAAILLPNQYVLPRAKRTGMVLNLAEMRVYYFPVPKLGELPVVITYPVSIGRMNWKTPLGNAQVIAKQIGPAWIPPDSIKKEAKALGEVLPDVVGPGPDNPLGQYAIRLSIPGYLIHGTNKPYGVGMRVTHGCVRMYPEDIEELFNAIKIGTQVQIINQAIKVGWLDDILYLEAHPPLEEDVGQIKHNKQIAYDAISDALAERNTKYRIMLKYDVIMKALEERNGVPVPISR